MNDSIGVRPAASGTDTPLRPIRDLDYDLASIHLAADLGKSELAQQLTRAVRERLAGVADTVDAMGSILALHDKGGLTAGQTINALSVAVEKLGGAR